jgi:hypothetical protein
LCGKISAQLLFNELIAVFVIMTSQFIETLEGHVETGRFERFKQIISGCLQHEYFLMKQINDANGENLYDKITYLGVSKIEYLLDKELQGLEKNKNTVVKDKYSQVFMLQEEVDKAGNKIDASKVTIVNNYDEIFNGFFMIETFFVLLNSDDNDVPQFNVYIMQQHQGVEAYILVKIGYLIDPSGYCDEDISTFETRLNITLPDDFKIKLKDTKVIKVEEQLYLFDLTKPCNGVYESDNRTIEDKGMKKGDSLFRGFYHLGTFNKILIACGDNVDQLTTVKVFEESVYILLKHSIPIKEFNVSMWKYTFRNLNAMKALQQQVQCDIQDIDEMSQNLKWLSC